MPSPSYPDADQFVRAVGSAFRVAATVPLELASVTISAASARSFVLLFLGPALPLLPQQIHTLEHDALGAFDLFLVPIGPDHDSRRMRYEAVFG